MLNCREWIFTPKEGLLLLFPGELYHKVKVNESKQPRYSMSFNIMPTGLVGDEKSDSHVII
jgi:ectoine hydroxylase-related dioxygenase (phytanoyl-CoA dioxygenase family)